MEHRIFQLPSEYRSEIQQAIAQPIAHLKIFDSNLEIMGLHQNPGLDQLMALFKQGPHFQLQILVHTDQWLKSSAPRLVNLLEARSTQVEIRTTTAEAVNAPDTFIITPTTVVRKKVSAHPSGVVYVGDAREVEVQLSRWSALWASSEPLAAFRPFGL